MMTAAKDQRFTVTAVYSDPSIFSSPYSILTVSTNLVNNQIRSAEVGGILLMLRELSGEGTLGEQVG